MGIGNKISNLLHPSPTSDVIEVTPAYSGSEISDAGEKGKREYEIHVNSAPAAEAAGGVSTIEAAQAVWGKKGFRLILIGYISILIFWFQRTSLTFSNRLAMMMILLYGKRFLISGLVMAQKVDSLTVNSIILPYIPTVTMPPPISVSSQLLGR